MRVLIAEFDPKSLGYLHTISGGAPIELERNPTIFVSAPIMEDIDHEATSTIDLQFNSAKLLFNPRLKQSELDIFLDLVTHRTDLAEFLVGPLPNMKPYFKWVNDPLRGASAKNFCLSLVNTLNMDLKPLRATLRSVTLDDPVCSMFNTSVLTCDQPDHKNSYGAYPNS